MARLSDCLQLVSKWNNQDINTLEGLAQSYRENGVRGTDAYIAAAEDMGHNTAAERARFVERLGQEVQGPPAEPAPKAEPSAEGETTAKPQAEPVPKIEPTQPEAQARQLDESGVKVRDQSRYDGFAPWVREAMDAAEAKGQDAVLSLGIAHEYTIYKNGRRIEFDGDGSRPEAISESNSGPDAVVTATRHSGIDAVIAMTSSAQRKFDDRAANIKARADADAAEAARIAEARRVEDENRTTLESLLSGEKFKKGEFTLTTTEGEALSPVSSWLHKNLAVHKEDTGRYTVSHIGTGARLIGEFRSLASAKLAAVRLSRAADFSKLKTRSDVRKPEFQMAIKVANAIRDTGDPLAHPISSAGTLYGGLPKPVVDAVGHLLSLDKQSRAKWVDWWVGVSRSVADSFKRKPKQLGDSGQNPVARVARRLWHDLHTDLIVAIDKAGGSPTARMIADAFDYEMGTGKGPQQTIPEAADDALGKFLGDLSPALEAADKMITEGWQNSGRKGTKEAYTDAVWQQIRKQVFHPASRQGEIGKIANGIAPVLKKILEYAKAAGIDMGDQGPAYFPHVLDPDKIGRSSDQFVADASKAFQAEFGMSKKMADSAAAEWLSREINGGFTPVADLQRGGTEPSYSKQRVFRAGGPGEAILNKWYQTDGIDTLLHYVRSITNRAEVARRFGDNFNKWPELREQIIDEGGGSLIDQIKSYIVHGAGLRADDTSYFMRRAAEFIRGATTLGALEASFLANTMEFIAPLVTTHADIPSALETLSGTVRALTNKLVKSGRYEALKEFAEDSSLILGQGLDHINIERHHGYHAAGDKASKILSHFFERNLMNQETRMQRTIDAGVGQVYVRRLAKAVLGKSKLDTAQSASAILRDLSVPAGKEKEFAQWLEGFGDKLPTHAIGGNDPMATVYRNVLRRFVNTTSVQGHTTTRPAYANTTLGAIFYQLANYTGLFHKRILRRTGNEMKQALTRPDLSAGDRAVMAAGMLPGLAMYTLAAYGLMEVYDRVVAKLRGTNRNLTPVAKAERALNYGNIMGRYTKPFEALAGQRYGRGVVTAFTAPAFAGLAQGVDTATAEFRNEVRSSLTGEAESNATKRKFLRWFYNYVMEPVFQTAMTATPIGLPGSAATIFGPSAVQPHFLDTFAGEETPQQKAQRQKPQRGVVESLVHRKNTGGGRAYLPPKPPRNMMPGSTRKQ